MQQHQQQPEQQQQQQQQHTASSAVRAAIGSGSGNGNGSGSGSSGSSNGMVRPPGFKRPHPGKLDFDPVMGGSGSVGSPALIRPALAGVGGIAARRGPPVMPLPASAAAMPSLFGSRAAVEPAGAFAGQQQQQQQQQPLPRRRMPGLSLADLGVPAASLTPAGAAAAEASMVAVNAGGTRASATAAAAAAAAAATATSTSSATSSGTPFGGFAQFVDASGSLNFANKAAIHAGGVDFSSGTSYAINMSELDVKEELGRGQYGVVHRVLHKPTGAVMAMKQIRLELDNTRFKQIITELDVLNQASSPFIVDFYGAFFVESCVYYCMECMDGGSLQRLYTITHGGSEESTDQQQSGSSSNSGGGGGGVPEHILARVGYAVVSGLHFLKTKLNVIHRDVKPSNVLCSRAGDIKLCDFGVSGQLVQSLANTYTGCQAYLAPERIVGESKHSYTVQSDVWSFGITLVECSMGRYPYESVQYESMFAQLDAIVNGEPPLPPAGSVSDTCVDFLSKCLEKEPAKRASYPKLLEHPFLTAVADAPKDEMAKWVNAALDRIEGTSNSSSVNLKASSVAPMAIQKNPAHMVPSLSDEDLAALSISSPSNATAVNAKEDVSSPRQVPAQLNHHSQHSHIRRTSSPLMMAHKVNDVDTPAPEEARRRLAMLAQAAAASSANRF